MPTDPKKLALSEQMYYRRKGVDASIPSAQDAHAYAQMQAQAQAAVAKRAAAAPTFKHGPIVGVSHRSGHGYDLHALESIHVEPVASPAGLKAPGRNDSEAQNTKNEQDSVAARRAALANGGQQLREQLRHVDGIYIPGGQDVASTVPDSNKSRLDYEAALMHIARQRGIPVLGICGGSRRVASAYGVPEAELEGDALATHNQRGTATMAHPLVFPDEHSILGGARGANGAMRSVDSINSTHSKVMATEEEAVTLPVEFLQPARLKNVETVKAPHHNDVLFGSAMRTLEVRQTPLLSVSAMDPVTRTPEGFETAFGAPHIGVTSHPEAIAGGSSAAVRAATPQGKAWSNHVMKSFEQAVQTYQNRRLVNAQILKDVKKVN